VSQSAAILRDLQNGMRLTPLDALHRYGCNRLAARVYELKRLGYPITSRLVKRGDAEVAEYSIVGELFA